MPENRRGRADPSAAPPEPALAEVLAVLDGLYPPATAADWDASGLVCGDPADPVRRVLFAVDPVQAVVDEALEWGADLLVVHHPLLLRPVSSVAVTTPKGRLVHQLVRAGCALYVAHTTADVAAPGVSDALARRLGLDDLVPLLAGPAEPLDKLVVFVPQGDADSVLDALSGAGAGTLGQYSRCAWATTGTGTFVPGAGAAPTIGQPGRTQTVVESRLEMVLPRARRAAVVAALRQAHPYEEPAFDVLELASWPGPTGTGRVGSLPATTTLERFAVMVAAALPATVQGVRVAGDQGAPVRRVAVCGGSGDSMFEAVRASGADVFVTADLRHHPASELQEATGGGPPYLVDVAHWASEWPWLAGCAELLLAGLSVAGPGGPGSPPAGTAGGPPVRTGTTVETRVSTRRTDPWTFRLPSSGGLVR